MATSDLLFFVGQPSVSVLLPAQGTLVEKAFFRVNGDGPTRLLPKGMR